MLLCLVDEHACMRVSRARHCQRNPCLVQSLETPGRDRDGSLVNKLSLMVVLLKINRLIFFVRLSDPKLAPHAKLSARALLTVKGPPFRPSSATNGHMFPISCLTRLAELE